ncbi:hypothetical protein KW782_03320 [Candidatus Parcubacteria bacterium]|nr:hypothetical protein [Candidatus Parcubacteria bacterium]
MNNKLMDIYDRQYDETFNTLLNKGTDREEAKSLMGLIFQKTRETLTKKDTKKENIETVFNKVRMEYGIC